MIQVEMLRAKHYAINIKHAGKRRRWRSNTNTMHVQADLWTQSQLFCDHRQVQLNRGIRPTVNCCKHWGHNIKTQNKSCRNRLHSCSSMSSWDNVDCIREDDKWRKQSPQTCLQTEYALLTWHWVERARATWQISTGVHMIIQSYMTRLTWVGKGVP